MLVEDVFALERLVSPARQSERVETDHALLRHGKFASDSLEQDSWSIHMINAHDHDQRTLRHLFRPEQEMESRNENAKIVCSEMDRKKSAPLNACRTGPPPPRSVIRQDRQSQVGEKKLNPNRKIRNSNLSENEFWTAGLFKKKIAFDPPSNLYKV